ncbi:MAG: sigma 54-interacting transcriptional regulator [Acidobacteriota bacterium]
MTDRPAPNDSTTLIASERRDRTEDPDVVLLTVLSHPDPRRIGERAVLTEIEILGSAELARNVPRFTQPGSPWSDRTLEDPFLSRKPWRLKLLEEGLELVRGRSSTELRLDGFKVQEAAHVNRQDLATGVTLELAGRIALLLHRTAQSALQLSEKRPPTRRMVGASAGMLGVRGAIDRVADLDVPVLIRGESGTGKELVAKALHEQGSRASRPFVAVDLGALSPALAPAELFGHAKGAFTGAQSAREGFFRAADGGTLFLDEIGEATAEVQAMLLRVIETRQVLPVGSHRPVPIDVRLLAATDSDLESRVRSGEFKEPLLHRLAAYVIRIPALRERREDIGRLFAHLARPVLRDLGQEQILERSSGPRRPWIPASLMGGLAREPWPGNVRQLANVVRQLVIDSRESGRLREIRLPSEMAPPGKPRSPARPSPPTLAKPAPPGPSPAGTGEGRRPSQITEEELEEAMAECGFEPAAAARRLRIGRPSLYNLVRRHPSLHLASEIPPREISEALHAVGGNLADAAQRLCVSKRALGRRVTRLGLGEKDERRG